MKDLSGTDKTYMYDGFRVRECPFFIYEVSLNKYWKNGYSLLSSKLYKSDEYIPIKKHSQCSKKGTYLIEKAISLIGITRDFIREHNLSEYNPNAKFKRKSKKNK